MNGMEVISGYGGFSEYLFAGLDFGGGDQGGNFNLIELQTNASLPGSSVPEPATYLLFGIGFIISAGVMRRCRWSVDQS